MARPGQHGDTLERTVTIDIHPLYRMIAIFRITGNTPRLARPPCQRSLPELTWCEGQLTVSVRWSCMATDTSLQMHPVSPCIASPQALGGAYRSPWNFPSPDVLSGQILPLRFRPCPESPTVSGPVTGPRRCICPDRTCCVSEGFG